LSKVVPHLDLFPAIFYFQFLEQRKAPFGSVKVWRILNPFEIILIRFKNQIGRHCAAGPMCQHRAALPRPPAPSRCPRGTAVTRSHPSAARVTHVPPPSTIARQRRRLRPLAGGRCRPPELSPVALGPPLSSRFCPPRDAHTRTPCLPLFPSVARPSAVNSHRPPSRSPFRPASSDPRSSTLPPPPSTLDSVHRPRTSGSSRSRDAFSTAAVAAPHPHPTVRPANPLPFLDLGPPSLLLSSPAAPGASRSCRRPSLR
jgi:hypothetical protein